MSQLREEIVEYSDDRWKVRLVLREATVLSALRHGVMQNQARREKDEDSLRAWVRAEVFPDLFCAVAEGSFELDGVQLWPLDFEAYANLPEMPVALSDAWYAGVYKVNPSWNEEAAKASGPKAEETTNPATSSTPDSISS